MDEFAWGGFGGHLRNAGLTQCHVLVVDDDPVCSSEYTETIGSLGYRAANAPNAATALRKITESPAIGIVITDLLMPVMDGITFLDEIFSRFSTVRPLVAIVITGFGSLDTAVQAMRYNAVDFLTKPVSREDLAAALRRASSRWIQLVGQFRLAALANAGGASQVVTERTASPPAQLGPAPDQLSNKELLAFARSFIKSRQCRADFLDPELFSDPAWDILLDLTCARLEGQPVPVSSACAAAQVPMTTALRHIRNLVDCGLVKRWQDPDDRRRDLLELEEQTLVAMTQYLTTTWHRLGNGRV